MKDILLIIRKRIIKMNKIHIFFTINDTYCFHLAVAMVSILKNSKLNDNFHFHVISSDLKEESKNKLMLLKTIKDFEIEFLYIDKKIFANFPPYYAKHITVESCFRLKIASMKPELEKAIYLDSDLVVTGSLNDLWNLDISENYIAASLDVYSEKIKKILNISFVDQYFNAGILLMNLKKWNLDNIEEKFFYNMDKYRNNLTIPDQDIMNITFAGKTKLLSSEWNFCPLLLECKNKFELEKIKNPIIIHYAGSPKPWVKNDNRYSEYYLKYADLVPFKNNWI